jgi:hypothetical protein
MPIPLPFNFSDLKWSDRMAADELDLDEGVALTRASLEQAIARTQELATWSPEKLNESQSLFDAASALFGTAHDFTTATEKFKRTENLSATDQLQAAADALDRIRPPHPSPDVQNSSPHETTTRFLIFVLPLVPAVWYALT